jgi:arylsulfatase A-like enzyme/Flp pilus assembly protein TadD
MKIVAAIMAQMILFLSVISFSVAAETSSGLPPVTPDTIILFSLDTTRADRMSCYGYELETTPRIDALAEESLFFEHPFSPAPMTLPSHSSMFTGLIPPTHGVHENIKSVLPESALTLAEVLQENGYTTYGIVSTIVLRKNRGLNQGFHTYDDDIEGEVTVAHDSPRNGKETTTRALQWLTDNADKKKFMFIHYFDPHAAFNPPAPFDTQFEDPYDGEIAFTDHCVGQVLDKLKALGLYENALIGLVGDHGEMLGEHGEPYHSFFIYQNVMRVPMLFKLPGGILAKKVSDPTSLIDVTPTLLSMGNLPVPGAMQGTDLSQYLQPQFSLPDRAIFGESMSPTEFNCSSLLGIVMDRWHYIQSTRPELYDRIADPEENRNLIDLEPERAAAMQEVLKKLLQETERSDTDSSVEVDAETLEQLESLGYLGGDVELDYTFEEGKGDAKDMIAVQTRVFGARDLAHSGQRDQAIRDCHEIMTEYPRVAVTYHILANIYLKDKNYKQAIAVMEQKALHFPGDTSSLRSLAQIYTTVGAFPKATDMLNAIIALKDDDLRAYKALVNVYTRQKAFDKVIATIQRKRAVLPDDAETLLILGKNYQRVNDARRALDSFVAALALDPESVEASVGAAGTCLKLGDTKQAVVYYERAVTQDARLPEVQRMLAWLKATHKDPLIHDPESALIHAQIAKELCIDKITNKCENPDILNALAVALAANGRFDEAITAATDSMRLYKNKGLMVQSEKINGRISYFKLQKAENP